MEPVPHDRLTTGKRFVSPSSHLVLWRMTAWALSLGLVEEVTAALLRFRWTTCVDGTSPAGDGRRRPSTTNGGSSARIIGSTALFNALAAAFVSLFAYSTSALGAGWHGPAVSIASSTMS